MMKRILALLLCAATLVSMLAVFTSCGKKDEDYKGQYITIYLTDNVYDLDPVKAYKNEALAKVVSLMFDTLFTLDEKGKVKKSLVKEYWTEENESAGEYKMYLRLKETNWSDGTAVSANDIVFAWKRLLEVDADYEAASLLFDIKNARAAKEGDASIDDVAIYPSEQQLLEIQFEGKIDYDQFLLNLTSLALAPLRDDIVSKSDDWAKKPGTMVCSGPFKLGRINWIQDMTKKYTDDTYVEIVKETGELAYDENGQPITGGEFFSQRVSDFILERNVYYYRDVEKDDLFKSVEPYRLCVDCSLTDEQLESAYDAGVIMYVGDIPLSLRSGSSLSSAAEVAETSLSTNALYFNQNAVVDDGSEEGFKLFAIPEVRQALSLAIDRDALVDAIVYAEAATGLVPTGVFQTDSSKTTFRSQAGSASEYLSYDLSEAKSLLSSAGIDPSKYYFTLTYADYDEVHTTVATEIVKAWQALGFNAQLMGYDKNGEMTDESKLTVRSTIINNDYYKYTKEYTSDICDDLYAEDLKSGNFQVILFDSVAYTADAYSILAPYAKAFSGKAMDMSDTSNYQLTAHVTGYDSEEYNDIMEAVYFLQYYDKFNSTTGVLATTYFNQYESAADNAAAEKAMYDKITAIYEEYNVSTDPKNYLEARATLLHAAEDILMKDMPVAPLFFNLEATVTSSKLKGLDSTYYVPTTFTQAEIKSYDDYLAAGKEFLNKNFYKDGVAMGFTKSVGCAFTIKDNPTQEDIDAALDLFKTANTVYSQFYLDEKEATASANKPAATPASSSASDEEEKEEEATAA